ncbi:hypothetical protein Goari_022267 [Gossypium aridum]|uniref:Uncharacterized protein n=1 Tax=Gossypium aridum TaxID=34290 RepID=A0A7J8YSS3_GOSAI|nr:hypothetical protein [Gossypium aridum]
MTSTGGHENWKPLKTWTRPITPTQRRCCWRCDFDWEKNRKNLVNCALGFARGTTGGKGGEFYVVTNPIDNATDRKPGTLRHAVTQTGPLWITFKRSMPSSWNRSSLLQVTRPLM